MISTRLCCQTPTQLEKLNQQYVEKEKRQIYKPIGGAKINSNGF